MPLFKMNFKGLKSLMLCCNIFLSLFEQVYMSGSMVYTAIIKNEVGTQVLSEHPIGSESLCAILCNREISCIGFSWKEGNSVNCAILKSLHESLPEADATIFMKLPNYRVIETVYPTTDYGIAYGVPPMILDCSPGGTGSNTGILVGLASRSEMDDVDYMICADFPLLTVDLSDGAAYDASSNKTFPSFVTTAIYGNDQEFNGPATFKYKVRNTIGGNPTWSDECVAVESNHFPTPWFFPLDAKKLKSWRICPPQMYMSHLYRDSENYQDLRLYCCTLKYL